MKNKRSIESLILVISLGFLSFGCTQNSKGVTPIQKGGGGNSDGISKPDKKAIQDALNDKVLFLLEPSSRVAAAQPKAVVFTAEFKVNNKGSIHRWRTVMNLEIGDDDASANLPADYGLGEEKLALKVTGRRIKKSDKKEDLGYLVLAYELGRIGDDQDQTKKSLFLVMLNANMVNSPKAIRSVQVVYPIPDNFSLQVWIDKQLKQP